MYIEDIIILASIINTSPWDATIINSFQTQLIQGIGFTEKQASLALRILNKYLSKLNVVAGKDLADSLEMPKFKFKIRTLNSNKCISIILDQAHGKLIKVEFPFNEELVTKIRAIRNDLTYAAWHAESKSWHFSLDERSIVVLAEISQQYDFIVDEEFKNFVTQAQEIQSNLDNYVPIIVHNTTGYKFNNVHSNVPQPAATELISALFEARKVGINTWDETIDNELAVDPANKLVKDFLKSDPAKPFMLNPIETNISFLKDIVTNLFPCLIVIPGGSELEKIKTSVAFLKEIGVNSQDISVLFRLPGKASNGFNEFVKDEDLNNPISNDTKVVFISSKIRKTLIESNKEFNCIINFNFYNIHYTVRDFLRWHHNVIHLTNTTATQKGFNFGIM